MTHSYYSQSLPDKLTNVALAADSNGITFTYKYRIMPEYAAAGLWSMPIDLAKFVLSIMESYS
jgi:hypothetical protein